MTKLEAAYLLNLLYQKQSKITTTTYKDLP